MQENTLCTKICSTLEISKSSFPQFLSIYKPDIFVDCLHILLNNGELTAEEWNYCYCSACDNIFRKTGNSVSTNFDDTAVTAVDSTDQSNAFRQTNPLGGSPYCVWINETHSIWVRSDKGVPTVYMKRDGFCHSWNHSINLEKKKNSILLSYNFNSIIFLLDL